MVWTYTQVLLLTVVLCLWLSPLTLCYEIVIPPQSMVVFTDSKAVFTCKTSFPSFTWRVNGTFLSQLDDSIQADLFTDDDTQSALYNLTITARATYNGSMIQAVASVPGGAFAESENATLRIQDLPALVNDVSVITGSDSILLSWSPPFSLDVTGVDSDIWYTVIIFNVTDEDNPTAVPCTDCHNLTQPHYTFTTANPSPCHKYSFTVIPQNGAGNGSRSEPVEGAFVAVAGTFEVKTTVTYVDDEELTVLLDLQPVGADFCYTYIYIESEQGVPLTHKPYTTDPLTVSTEDSGLEFNSKYLIIVEGGYGSVKSNASRTFPLSTFDVQSIEAVAGDGMLIITAQFIVNSPARGCFIVVKCNSSSVDRMMAVLNTSSPAVVTGLEPNTYDILVYDVEETGRLNENPATVLENKTVSQEGSMPTTEKDLRVLESVTIDVDGDQARVTCHFRTEDSPSQQCVIVCRKSTESVLMIKYYPMDTEFPVKLPLSEPGNYTVAVFGWSEEMIETSPKLLQQVHIAQDTGSTTQSPSSGSGLGIVVGGVVTITAVVIVLVVVGVAITVTCRKIRNKTGTSEANFPEVKNTKPSDTCTTTSSEEKKHLITGGNIASDGVQRSSTIQSVGAGEGERKVVNNGPVEVKDVVPTSASQGVKYVTVSNPAVVKTLPPVDSSVQYQQIDQKATKRQAHPQQLMYAELGPRPEGLPRKQPADDPPPQYAIVLPHAIPPGKGTEEKAMPVTGEDGKPMEAHEVPAQECSDSSCQKSGVVSNTRDWELNNSDGDRGSGGQPKPQEKGNAPVGEWQPLKNYNYPLDPYEGGEEDSDTTPLLPVHAVHAQWTNGRDSLVM